MIRATDFYSEEAYNEALFEEQSGPTTIAEADQAYAHALSAERPEAAWVLSDRDVWYRNPFYVGPPQPHPEDDRGAYDEDDEPTGCPFCSRMAEAHAEPGVCEFTTDADGAPIDFGSDEDIPF